MKKRIIIPIIIFVVAGIICYLLFSKKQLSTINIEINPSIKLELDDKDIVKNVYALNDDAKRIVNDELKDKNIDESLNIIAVNLIDNDFIEDGKVTVLVNTTGNIGSGEIHDKIIKAFTSRNIETQVTIIENITKEDEELASKYNISPLKASYIKTVSDNIEDVDIDYLKEKSIDQITEIKLTGNYCEEGYTLDGNDCLKEIKREPAIHGEICPNNYLEYNGKCYLETRLSESNKLICHDDFELIGNDCVKEDVYDAEKVCEEGNLDGNYCVTKKYIADAYEFCRDPGRTLYEHKCLATKPSINGGCLNGDKYLNGKCVNTRNDYYIAEWKCPNGKVKSNADGSLLDNDTKCYEDVKTKVTKYRCDGESILEGDKCHITRKHEAEKEVFCKEGFTLINNNRCLNLNDETDKIAGLECTGDNTKLKGSECVYYEVVEAKHKGASNGN